MTVAYQLEEAGTRLSRTTIARRPLGPRDVRLDLKFCGICHSDLVAASDKLGGGMFPMGVIGLVTRHASLESFLFEHNQRFMNSVDSINRRRVMVRALRALTPIAHDEIHIQEPALDFLSTSTNYVHSRITKGDGRDTR